MNYAIAIVAVFVVFRIGWYYGETRARKDLSRYFVNLEEVIRETFSLTEGVEGSTETLNVFNERLKKRDMFK